MKSEMLTAIIKAGVNSQSLDAPPEHFLDVVRNAKEMLGDFGISGSEQPSLETYAHPNRVYLPPPAIT